MLKMLELLKKTLVFHLMCLLVGSYASTSVTEKEYVSMPPVFHADDIDRCMLHGNEALYCSISIQLRPKNSENVSQTWRIIEKANSNPRHYRHDLLRHKICVTEMLPRNHNIVKNQTEVALKLTSFYRNKYRNKGILGDVTITRCERNKSDLGNAYDTLFLFFIIAYTFVIICATLLDLFYSEILEKNDRTVKGYYEKFISAMSLKKNWTRLTTVNLLNKDALDLSCIQGIRVYSLFKIILVHTYLGSFMGFISNTHIIEQVISNTPIEQLSDPAFTVQCFYMISFWLLSYNFFVDIKDQKSVSVRYMVNIFTKRYLRLTPTLACVVFFSSTWLLHTSQGTVWDIIIENEVKKCRQNGWFTLLYINNFVNKENICFVPGWFLTVNMQLYIISLPLLWIMWKYQKRLPSILGGVLFGHIFYLFYITYFNGFNYAFRIPGIEYMATIFYVKEYYYIYASVIANGSAAIAGLSYGYIFYKRQNQVFLKDKFLLTFWWRVALGINVISWTLPLFITIDPKVNPIFNAVYASLWRAIFNFSSGMIILGITEGQGGFLKWILETKTIYILGRLSYCAYLTHALLIQVRIGMKRSVFYWSHYSTILDFLSDLSLGLLTALILTLFVEMPLSELCKNFMKKRTKVKKQD